MGLIILIIVLLLLFGGGGSYYWSRNAGWSIGPIGLIVVILIIASILYGYHGRIGY